MSETSTKQPTGMGTIGPVRFSYMSVFKPRKNDLKDGRLEYSLVCLIPKAANQFCPDPKSVGSRTAALIKAVAAEKWGADAKGWTTCLKDGDAEKNDEGEPKHPGYWFFRATANVEYPPVLVDAGRNTVLDGWQSGDWGNVQVRFWPYDQKGNKGVSCGLRAIQFVRHDEALGMVTDPVAIANAFEQVEGDAPLTSGSHASDPPTEYDPWGPSETA